MKKYELTNETKFINGVKVYRIVAMRDFADVKAGDLGGFVQSEHNLSQLDDCWLYNDACVYGDANVFRNAQVYNNCEISGRVQFGGNAAMWGEVKLAGHFRIDGGSIFETWGQLTARGVM